MMMQIAPVYEDRQDERREECDDDDVSKKIPPWGEQITVRGVAASFVIGSIFSIIAMKLNLTTGINPNLNVSAALLGFIFVRIWKWVVEKVGLVTVPFTQQENTMIQTCVVACYGIAIGGGFGSFLLAMDKKTYELTGGSSTEGNSPGSYKEPGIGWMIGFLFLVCFIGLFVLIPLRKILIIDYKLSFPSGMATSVLINGFHNQKEDAARKQIQGFFKYFSISFFWGFFQWLYTGKLGGCGFSKFPTFGLEALKNSFYFDFSMTYIGTGMICPHIVNISGLFGAVLSWGIMWPLISNLKGHWFDADIPESSMKSLGGYKIFISIALILGDGLYYFVKVIISTFINFKMRQRNFSSASSRQNEVFVRDKIPPWISIIGFIVLTIISSIAIPFIFPELKWYYIIVACILSPPLAFCNAYGAGLTDMNMSYNYSKVGLFILAAIVGKEHGVIAGLAGCALIKSVVNNSCLLMQDFKTGHLTMSSPRAMLISQAIGTSIGCIVCPLSFYLFYKAFDIGNPNGEYKAPYAVIYRNMAILGVEGFSALPKHCLQLGYGFFAFAVVVNLLRDIDPCGIGKWMPIPIAMAMPFITGAYFAIDMFLGSVVVFVSSKMNKSEAKSMVPAVASGLICGEGLWMLPAAVLSLAKIYPPMCMKFMPS